MKKTIIISAMALAFSAIYLVSGYCIAHNVVKTEYDVVTDKEIEDISVVLISDSHLGAIFNGEGFARELAKIQEVNPDIVVIAGDFVDGGSKYEDIVSATAALGKLKTKYGVYYCYGNHDRNFYRFNSDYTDEQLEGELIKNNITILKDEFIDIPGGVTILGREDAVNKNRLPIDKLMEQIDSNRYVICINHQPNDYDAEEKAGVDMVLSGHTHGGQLIPINDVGIWIGANDKIYGREKRSDTEFIVSSGIADWELDFKTGCISEFVLINIKKSL